MGGTNAMGLNSLVYLIDGGVPTVQEILDGVEAHSALADEVERLRDENKRLRDALEIMSTRRDGEDEISVGNA